MKYLILAEKYALSNGDEMYFKYLYTGFREYYTVKDSVWKTLNHLYSNEVADMLEESV
jgi:hypothetical protein